MSERAEFHSFADAMEAERIREVGRRIARDWRQCNIHHIMLVMHSLLMPLVEVLDVPIAESPVQGFASSKSDLERVLTLHRINPVLQADLGLLRTGSWTALLPADDDGNRELLILSSHQVGDFIAEKIQPDKAFKYNYCQPRGLLLHVMLRHAAYVQVAVDILISVHFSMKYCPLAVPVPSRARQSLHLLEKFVGLIDPVAAASHGDSPRIATRALYHVGDDPKYGPRKLSADYLCPSALLPLRAWVEANSAPGDGYLKEVVETHKIDSLVAFLRLLQDCLQAVHNGVGLSARQMCWWNARVPFCSEETQVLEGFVAQLDGF